MTEPVSNERPFKVGDRVRMKPGWYYYRWRPDDNRENYSRLGTVVLVAPRLFRVRPDDRRQSVSFYWIHSERFALVSDGLPNIYADWLEDNATAANNFQAAADALRKTFAGVLP